MTVKIKAFARRGRTGEIIEVTEGLFTYVAVDAEGKSRPVHPLNKQSGTQLRLLMSAFGVALPPVARSLLPNVCRSHRCRN